MLDCFYLIFERLNNKICINCLVITIETKLFDIILLYSYYYAEMSIFTNDDDDDDETEKKKIERKERSGTI